MLLVQVQQFRNGTRYDLEVLHQCSKGFKLKDRKFWGPIPTFVEVRGEKLVGGLFDPPILNRMKAKKVIAEHAFPKKIFSLVPQSIPIIKRIILK